MSPYQTRIVENLTRCQTNVNDKRLNLISKDNLPNQQSLVGFYTGIHFFGHYIIEEHLRSFSVLKNSEFFFVNSDLNLK